MCGWVLQSEEDKHGTPASMDEKWCGEKGNCKMMKMEKTLFMFNTFVFSYFHQFSFGPRHDTESFHLSYCGNDHCQSRSLIHQLTVAQFPSPLVFPLFRHTHHKYTDEKMISPGT